MLRPRPRRFLRAAATFAAQGFLCGCGHIDIELLTPRSDAGSRDAGAVRDAGPALDASPMPADASPVPADASGTPPTPDSGTSTCPGGLLICEDFETSLAGWTFVRSDGTATATMQDSHSGVGSLELATRSAGAFAYLESRLMPVSSGTLYLRAFLKVPASNAATVYDVVAVSNASADVGVAASFSGTGMSLSSLSTNAAAPGKVPFPRGDWVCFELALSVSAASSAQSELNGVLDATLLIEGGVPSGGYSRVALGVVRSAPTQGPTRILVDDLVIATSPIGCE